VTSAPTATPVLSVEDLEVTVHRPQGSFVAVDGVSLSLRSGGALGLVGESGCGKTLTLRALMGSLTSSVSVTGGRATLSGEPLALTGRHLSRARRGRMAMVFQEPISALDPVMAVGTQVAEAPRRVLGMSARAARARAVELLHLVGIADPEIRAEAYPHQLSGGTRQRVMIAVALSSEPSVLVCDEPTTALDVTIQSQVLRLLADLRERLDLSMLFVSHDLAVVNQVCEELAVMYSGKVVEAGPTHLVLSQPRHPYTDGLVKATPRLTRRDRPPKPIPGILPDPARRPDGCAFHPRCSFATEICRHGEVEDFTLEGGRRSACWHHDEVGAPT
jgi:oligopeptide/dipeptide ABC transporter ATP-binding protein